MKYLDLIIKVIALFVSIIGNFEKLKVFFEDVKESNRDWRIKVNENPDSVKLFDVFGFWICFIIYSAIGILAFIIMFLEATSAIINNPSKLIMVLSPLYLLVAGFIIFALLRFLYITNPYKNYRLKMITVKS